ncbi:MAG TPA: acyl-CoA dehydrogenase family protein [Chloroflexota bacterium]|nr:acyl-CoA dehydrogenase family protein [Chloroflexota bacterium]
MGEELARARELAPLVASMADQVEADRRLPQPLMEALHEAGLFRLLLPRSLDGGEVDPPKFVRILMQIAKADASTAWVLGQTTVCAMVAPYLSREAAERVFGDKRAILSWGPATQVKVTPEPGGCRVSGRFAFSSGGRHATWLGLQYPLFNADGTPKRREDGSADGRTLLVPAEQVTMTDVWRVMGLRGTGSDSYSVEDLFVPAELDVHRDEAAARTEDGLLYRFSTYTMFSIGFAGVALGIARGLLDAFVDLAAGKTARGQAKTVRESQVVQYQAALAEGRWRAAEAYLLGSVDQVWGEICREPRELSLEQRMRLRLAGSQAQRDAAEVADMAYHLAGSSAIFDNGPFERRFRDMHAVRQQLQGRWDHFERVGQYLLGLWTEPLFL